MKPLSKGDPCRVRLHTGEVVLADYHSQDQNRKKCHFVSMCDGHLALAWKYKPIAGDEFSYEVVRFVGNPCVLLPVVGECMSMSTNKPDAETHYQCKEIVKERDTYRDLCVGLLAFANTVKEYAEKYPHDTGLYDLVVCEIKKLEQLK